MQEVSLVTDQELTRVLNFSTTNEGRLSSLIGVSPVDGVVPSTGPNYTDYGSVISLTNGHNLARSMVTLDNTKNRKLDMVSLDGLGDPTTVLSNPDKIKFSRDFQVSNDASGSVLISLTEGVRYRPFPSPRVILSNPLNPTRRLSFSTNLGSLYPANNANVYGVFRILLHTKSVEAWIWIDLMVGQERCYRGMRRAVFTEDLTTRPIKLTGATVSGYFDVRRNGENTLYRVGPGITLGPGESATSDNYLAFGDIYSLQVQMLGLLY